MGSWLQSCNASSKAVMLEAGRSRRKKEFEGRSPAKMIRARAESSPRSVSFGAAEPFPIELWILTSQARSVPEIVTS